MAYKNNWNNSGYSTNKSNSNNYSYSPSSGQNKSYGSKKPNSGCKVYKNRKTQSGEIKEIVASGWLKTRAGLISYVGSPADKKYQTDSGNIKMVFKVTQGVQSQLYWGTFNPITNMLYIQNINIIGMPSRKSSFFRRSK